MDSEAEEVFDRFTRLASAILRCPISLMSLVDDSRQFFKSKTGVPDDLRETPLSHSFCQHVVIRDKPLIVEDAREDPLVMHNLAVPELGVIAYLGVPIHSQEGHVLGSFCAIDDKPRKWSVFELNTMQDLVRSIETELSLRDRNAAMLQLLEERNHSEKDRELMTRMLVHDMRNPMNPICAFIGLMKDRSDLDEIESKMRELADSGVTSLLEMIEQILEVYRMREGKLVLDRTTFKVTDLLREVYMQSLPLAESIGQYISVEYPATLRAIQADYGLLRRVLLNLLSNSTKYAGRLAHIRLGANVENHDWQLWVEDNGPGIPPENRASIFNAFERGALARVDNRASFGLGLAFCKLAAEAHSGSIEIIDTPDGFHRFVVRIPAVQN